MIRQPIPYLISRKRRAQMVNEAHWTCAICGVTHRNRRKLAIDHDHRIRRIRAVLCARCNQGLGYFLDNPILLENAAEYLRLWARNHGLDHHYPETKSVSNMTKIALKEINDLRCDCVKYQRLLH